MKIKPLKIHEITWVFYWVEANSLSIIPEDFCIMAFSMAEEGKLLGAHFLSSIYDTIKDVQNNSFSYGFHLNTHIKNLNTVAHIFLESSTFKILLWFEQFETRSHFNALWVTFRGLKEQQMMFKQIGFNKSSG